MRSSTLGAACALALLAWACTHAGAAAAAAAQDTTCLKGKQADLVRSSSLYEALITAMRGPQCASIGRVLAQLQAAKTPGGRKLHDGKPLDRAAAQQELKTARADPALVRRLVAASDGVTDPTARMVVEAALLDDEGYFSARQLLMEDIAKTQEAR